ncbi:hypothetical protein [Nocardioides campestrisoli]|uniref:hypothetical protein n=1 Tax=Nocardioides campestrisoli TaxID=2736757 RepID=UPI00163D67B1|nr:hypothetical protein [Nocardioides campestrisoli]
MDLYTGYDEPDQPGDYDFLRDDLPGPVNWNLLTADEAQYEWHDLDRWVKWLKTSHGLPPSIVPPFYYLHDELVWELSALHTHWLSCYHQTASPSAPIAWRRDFEDAKHRLRDWVAVSGTRLDRDRPTRVTSWPGEAPVAQAGDVEIADRDSHFEVFVRDDVLRRRRLEVLAERSRAG